MPLDEERNMVQYDIHNLVRFPNQSWLFVKVGDFIYGNSHDQGLVIKEEMINWSVRFKEVRCNFNMKYIQRWGQQIA